MLLAIRTALDIDHLRFVSRGLAADLNTLLPSDSVINVPLSHGIQGDAIRECVSQARFQCGSSTHSAVTTMQKIDEASRILLRTIHYHCNSKRWTKYNECEEYWQTALPYPNLATTVTLDTRQ